MSDIQKVGILGSGIMGSGLAEVAARAGYEVVVRSRSLTAANAMIASIDKGFAKAIERGKATEEERAAVLARITATDHLGAVADCDLVIESVVEDLAIKKALFAELEQIVKPSGILATNTSTLPVVEMAMVTQRPDKVVGIHFFNPAPMMKLVEVVRPITASDETVSAALAFAASCGKDGVEVKDRAGFIVNALLFPYLNNAVRMCEQGTASMETWRICEGRFEARVAPEDGCLELWREGERLPWRIQMADGARVGVREEKAWTRRRRRRRAAGASDAEAREASLATLCFTVESD